MEKERQLEALSLFCRPPAEYGLNGTVFSLLEAVEIAPLIVFVRIRASNEAIFIRGPVEYSQAMRLMEVDGGKLAIDREVQSMSSRFSRSSNLYLALASQRLTPASDFVLTPFFLPLYGNTAASSEAFAAAATAQDSADGDSVPEQ